jgi:3-oxoacyl-[acyl-carrier-protein] synthase I
VASVKRPLYISGGGAVTPGGLDLRQTIAAIRAGLSAFEEEFLVEPFATTQLMARVPTHYHLRRTQGAWLLNLAARSLAEALQGSKATPEESAVLISTPEGFRKHPAFDDIALADFLPALRRQLGVNFHPASRVIDGGAAANVGLLARAADILESQGARQILLGGVDSFLNDKDLARLRDAQRLAGEQNAQGLIPGEAAAFVRLTVAPEIDGAVVPAIRGLGVAQEQDNVLSERTSQGRAMLAALRSASSSPAPGEPDISFVVSNSNGERFSGLEQLIARSRFYQTRREMLATCYPAMTVGDVGAASGALALLVASDSLAKDYAPGPVAMCEVASENGMRAAATVLGMRRAS